jgi:hypothetical protein
MEVLGDLFGGEGLVGVGHDGADGLGAGLEVRRPVEGLGGGAVSRQWSGLRPSQLKRCLRFNGLGGLVRRAEVADVAFLFLGPPLGVTDPSSRRSGLLLSNRHR